MGSEKMANVLFTIIKSPFESNEFQIMEILAKDNDKGVLLFQDAVYYATMERFREELLTHGYAVYALKDELAARGFDKAPIEGVQTIDYDRAVELIMEEYDRVISL
jgi:sulfur relay protein TusB/DsrH